MGSNPTLAATAEEVACGTGTSGRAWVVLTLEITRPRCPRDWQRPAGRVTKVSDLGEERFTLTAAPPVRALAIASVVAIVGAALMVSSRALGLGAFVLAVGAAGLGFAVLLAIVAVVLVLRIRSTLVLDRDGITVIRARRTRRLSWSEIESVILTGPRLTLVTKASDRGDVSVLNLRSRSDPTFLSLVRAIQGRLDANRGYRTR